jgi:hypothetical protein
MKNADHSISKSPIDSNLVFLSEEITKVFQGAVDGCAIPVLKPEQPKQPEPEKSCPECDYDDSDSNNCWVCLGHSNFKPTPARALFEDMARSLGYSNVAVFAPSRSDFGCKLVIYQSDDTSEGSYTPTKQIEWGGAEIIKRLRDFLTDCLDRQVQLRR